MDTHAVVVTFSKPLCFFKESLSVPKPSCNSSPLNSGSIPRALYRLQYIRKSFPHHWVMVRSSMLMELLFFGLAVKPKSRLLVDFKGSNSHDSLCPGQFPAPALLYSTVL